MNQAMAVVYTAPGSPLEINTLALPQLAAGEVLVEMALCTLCGSDLHTYFGRRSTPTPTVLGHEILGRIVALGPGDTIHDFYGRPLELGQRITWSIAASCGSCFYCRHELPQKCAQLVKYGHEPLQPDFMLSGGLASHCHLKPGTTIVPIPAGLADEVACPANCATATVTGALRLANVQPGEVVLLHGGGMLGLTACAMLHARGVRDIVLCEPHAERRELARQFGASHTLPPDEQALGALLRDLTAGRGADAAFEFSGASQSVAQQLDHLRKGGRCVLVGTTLPTEPLSIDPERITRACWTIRGLHNYGPADLAHAVEFLAVHGDAYPFADLVTRVFPLDEATVAFEYAESSKAPRVGLRFTGHARV